jgi:DNA-binding LacI/PurR family transcriptional regulator
VLARLPEGLVEFRVIYGTYEINSGYARTRALIGDDSWWPTAIFTGSDRVAVGVIQALLESGHKVPEDMSLLGYDDQPSLAANVHPALTTITLPHLEMGQLAVNALLGQSGLGPDLRPITAHPKLIRRESIRNVGPPIEVPEDRRKPGPSSGHGRSRKGRERPSGATGVHRAG